MASPSNVYLFVIWHRGMDEAEKILGEIRAHFTVLKQFDVTWRPKDYLRNFAAFYGWKGYSMWFGKRNRAGIGPFRAVFVRDENPVFRDVENLGVPEMLRDENIYALKMACRKLTRHSNVVHASVNEAETRQNLNALLGETLEDFLSRADLDGSVSKLDIRQPMPFVPFPYAGEDKGLRFFRGKFKMNRVEVFLLPNCGLPTIFSFSVRLGGLFSVAFCIGKVKVG